MVYARSSTVKSSQTNTITFTDDEIITGSEEMYIATLVDVSQSSRSKFQCQQDVFETSMPPTAAKSLRVFFV